MLFQTYTKTDRNKVRRFNEKFIKSLTISFMQLVHTCHEIIFKTSLNWAEPSSANVEKKEKKKCNFDWDKGVGLTNIFL